MARSKTIREQGRWAGSPADLARLARTATGLLRERSDHEPVGSITVVMPGLEIRYDSPEEFERELATRDLPRVETITIAINDDTPDEFELVMRFGGGGARLTAAGPDRTFVEGLTTRLAEAAQEGRRAPWVNGPSVGFVWISLALSAVMLAFVSSIALDWIPDRWVLDVSGWYWVLGFGVLFGVIIVVGSVTAYVSPAFELLPHGAPTRFDRAGKRWKWFVGAVVAAVLAALASRWIA